MTLKLVGEDLAALRGLGSEGWLREVEAVDGSPGLRVTNTGSGGGLVVRVPNTSTTILSTRETNNSEFEGLRIEENGQSAFVTLRLGQHLEFNGLSSNKDWYIRSSLRLVAFENAGDVRLALGGGGVLDVQAPIQNKGAANGGRIAFDDEAIILSNRALFLNDGNWGLDKFVQTNHVIGIFGLPDGAASKMGFLNGYRGTWWAYTKGTTGEWVGVNGVLVGSSERPLAAAFVKTHDPASQAYAVGLTTLQTLNPASGYKGIAPVTWTLPAKAGNVEPRVTFVWDDNSASFRSNATAGAVTETWDAQAAAVASGKDGLAVKQMKFEANNVGGAPDTQDLGQFTFVGNQV
ncbi:MAG: hypothetical protein HY685_03690 [Chloroflexi bacterium]|nr:hypothetical protein [Chloroflexota bacterium]